MGRISKALKALQAKCTDEGVTPKGNSTADILECIADNFNVDGQDGQDGQDGADGVSVTAIALTTTEGAVTGGTATFSDGSTAAITVTEGE